MDKTGYVTTTLGDFCSIVMGQSPPSSSYNNRHQGLPFFQGKAEFTDLHPIAAKWCTESNRIAEENDVLISVRAPVGSTNIADRKCCIGRGLAVVRYVYCNKYIFFFLRSVAKKLDEQGTGTTFRAISGDVLRNYPINLAPIPEQRAIVAKIEQLFSELDNGIANLKKAQEQLKVYRQAVLKQAFEGELTRHWREGQTHLPLTSELIDRIAKEREEASKAQGKKLKPIKPITKEELSELPVLSEGWVWVSLGSCTLGVEYGTSSKSIEVGRVPVLRMGNIQNGKIDWDDLVYTDDEVEIKKFQLKNGDILFNRTNSPELVGKTAIYASSRQAIFAGYLIRINQLDVLLNSKYISYFLNSHFAKVFGDSVKTDGVNQSNINGEKLKAYPLPYCVVEEQQQIVQEIETRFSVCDNLESTIKASLEKSAALRQAILKKAFDGSLLTETEVEETRMVPDWEPAGKLLERIREARKKIGVKQ